MIIWLASYPRSGNTFFRVLLKSIFGIETYSIYDDRREIGADKKTSDVVGHKFLPKDFDLEKFRSSKEIYYIKTHDLPDKVKVDKNDKVIYIIRDGRESCLSFARYIQDYNGGKENVLADVLWGRVMFGSWGEHIDKWSRVEKFLVKFEDLVADPLKISLDLANYLGIKPINDKIPTFEELHLINPVFFRSGKNNSWKYNFSNLDNVIFWINNYKEMIDFGYADNIPSLLLEKIIKDTESLNYLVNYGRNFSNNEEADKIISEKNSIIEEKNECIRLKDEEIEKKNSDITEKENEIREKEKEIEFMKSSKFWKLRKLYVDSKNKLRGQK